MTWAPELTLAELADGGLFTDGDWVESKDQDPAGSVRLTQLADVGVGEFRNRSDRWMRTDQAASLGCTFLHANDILIARMPDPIGRACLAPVTIGAAVTAVDVAILRIARPDVDARYAMWAINSPRFHSLVVGRQSGTTRKRISRKNLATLSIPVPHLDEQRRIVDLLDDHLSRLDAADSYLATVGAREVLLHGQLLAAALADVEAGEARLSDLLAVGLANGRSVPTQHDGFPVLRLTALRNGRIDLGERKGGAWTREDAARFLVERDDFLISRGNGSLRLVGLGGLVVDEPDAVAYPDTLIRARPNVARLTAVYLAMVWNSPLVRRQIEAVARTTAGIYKVNQRDLGSITFPVPSLADQAVVVHKVQASRDSLGTVASERTRALARSRSLRRSLLTAAFSGRLTDDQPTEELE